jgi:ABC-2 type transport system ATP-binding protein
MADHDPSPADAAVKLEGVSRRFGAVVAMDEVSLCVPRGSVFGLVGVNGAGKTTLIKHVLGLLAAKEGRVRVFGLDPVADPVGVLSRVGYLAEENDLPGWIRVGELLRYTRAFYPGWNNPYAERLRAQFDLDPTAKVKHLSRGQRARAGLLLALAHRPELLVLDEPSSGLDPIVRRDILGAIIRTISDEGRTVLFSSHLLEEVERVSDHVAMLHEGKVVIASTIDELKRCYRRVTVRFHQPQPSPPSIPGGLAWKGGGREWTTVSNGDLESLRRGAAEAGARIVEETGASLDEIFVARVGARCPEPAEE